jgi:hypothetical protein
LELNLLYTDEAMEMEPPAKLAPDRDEIYHIKMPAGKINKTRDILQKQSILRDKGSTNNAPIQTSMWENH